LWQPIPCPSGYVCCFWCSWTKARKQVYEGLKALRRMRLQRKGVDVLVETAEKWKPRKKKRKTRIEPSKRLDTWMKD